MTLTLLKPAATGQRVYLGWDGCAHIKLGTSIDTKRRGGELKLQMIISIPGAEYEEHQLLKMWKRYHVDGEWVWPGDGMVAWLHAMIDSPGTRIECGTPADAHKLVNMMYERRWDIAA